VSSNYGPSGNDVGDPTTVDWVVVEHSALGSAEQDLLSRLLDHGGGFEVVLDGADVTVARRVAPDSLVPP
jgi:hypothetical protein